METTVVHDDFALIVGKLTNELARCDAVLLSGGVSMGDRDFVPDAVRQAGGEIVFHGLALRPGRPTLGAVGPLGQAVLGLPGNPLSVLVTVRRLAAIALRKLAGMAEIDPPAPRVSLTGTAMVHPEFRLFPPALLTPEGSARIVGQELRRSDHCRPDRWVCRNSAGRFRPLPGILLFLGADMTDGLTHLDDHGQLRMVDVSGKPITTRALSRRGAFEFPPGWQR